ncbi:hypothetical protein HanRHA438_Chr16g0758931 [Helianthus annuus]|nr:hypothetical protein HanRHA438_Chr16g0758931 [Helianthus annuus]
MGPIKHQILLDDQVHGRQLSHLNQLGFVCPVNETKKVIFYKDNRSQLWSTEGLNKVAIST